MIGNQIDNIIRTVIIGDMHIGHICGLALPEYFSEKEKSSFSLWNYERWCETAKKFNNPDNLLLIGDIGEGSQEIDKGYNAITTNPDVQVEIASKLLKMIIGDKTKIFGVNGSDYHDGGIDKRITESLGGKFKNIVFEFDIGTYKFQIAHSCTTGKKNPDSGLRTEIELARRNSDKLKVRSPDVIIRGHTHMSWMIQDDSGKIGILNPCWQWSTPYMEKKSANVYPNIGAYIIEIENGNIKPYRVDYPIPIEVIKEMRGFELLKSKLGLTPSPPRDYNDPRGK